jgi:hypothetical protein
MHALIDCGGVFRETGSVTHKKGAGRPIARPEEIVTRNNLRRTFYNSCSLTTFDQDNF